MMKLLRVDGTEMDLSHKPTLDEIRTLIGASHLDTVSLNRLKEGPHTLYVDDLGHKKGLRPNPLATGLYHTQCKPGTTWQIAGDAVVIKD